MLGRRLGRGDFEAVGEMTFARGRGSPYRETLLGFHRGRGWDDLGAVAVEPIPGTPRGVPTESKAVRINDDVSGRIFLCVQSGLQRGEDRAANRQRLTGTRRVTMDMVTEKMLRCLVKLDRKRSAREPPRPRGRPPGVYVGG